MSPVDRMKSLSLKLVSLGRIYAATPRYFPLGRNLPHLVFLSSRLFPLSDPFILLLNANVISLPRGTAYVGGVQCVFSKYALNYSRPV